MQDTQEIQSKTDQFMYQCNLCNKPFKRRERFYAHLNRKTPCVVQKNIDIFIDEINKLEKYLAVELDNKTKKIVKNKLTNLAIIYKNLNPADTLIADADYERFTELHKEVLRTI